MKQIKTTLILLMALATVIGCTGCKTEDSENTAGETSILVTTEPTEATTVEPHKSDPTNFVQFSRSTEPRECYVSVPELMEYESQYPDCNGTWFRDQLSREERLIYNCYLYAMENRFIHFTVYVKNADRRFSNARKSLSLDSPFLEQNYSDYERVSKQPINYLGERVTFSMDQFTDNRWEMKMEALEKCREVVQNIPPEYQTQQAKMEYLYDYVCDNVEYVTYESMADESYLYDAVCKGQTVCDGYSNMLSLLFRMIGVECCEVMGSNKEDQSGHTWVVAKLNGEFYNFDPTFEDTCEKKTDRRLFFGFSDDLLNVSVIGNQVPECEDTSMDFACADITVSSFTDWDAVEKMASLAEEKLDAGEDVFLVKVEGSVDSDQIDLFFDRFFVYFQQYKTVYVNGLPMGKNTLMEISFT